MINHTLFDSMHISVRIPSRLFFHVLCESLIGWEQSFGIGTSGKVVGYENNGLPKILDVSAVKMNSKKQYERHIFIENFVLRKRFRNKSIVKVNAIFQDDVSVYSMKF